ncbi:hypothetical protein AVEN_195236-1 [Araneus ventricosus]|uniref:Uncharacterized protein n=1 Tax=Araneus ventricosus TaxID=182803 RepID=A0A4Y2WJY7_ARAVE|nr:hypothetical protein AVEN_195236-1 [Araneus ventricosus]
MGLRSEQVFASLEAVSFMAELPIAQDGLYRCLRGSSRWLHGMGDYYTSTTEPRFFYSWFWVIQFTQGATAEKGEFFMVIQLTSLWCLVRDASQI